MSRASARSLVQRHVEGGVHPALAFHLGAAALADRDYEAAARFFAAAREEGHAFHSPRLLRALALGLAGHRADALAAVRAIHADSLPAHALPVEGLAGAAAGAGCEGERGAVGNGSGDGASPHFSSDGQSRSDVDALPLVPVGPRLTRKRWPSADTA